MKQTTFTETVLGGKIFTVPNLMSMFRLILIPFMLVAYIRDHYIAAGAMLLLSGATDIADGIVARHFNAVSELGKALDPAADKLTQASVLICLSVRHNEVVPLMSLFIFIQIVMSLTGIHTVQRTGEMVSARWYGKANTVILTLSMTAIIVFRLSGTVLRILTWGCFATGIITLTLYMIHYATMIRDSDRKAPEQSPDGGSDADGSVAEK